MQEEDTIEMESTLGKMIQDLDEWLVVDIVFDEPLDLTDRKRSKRDNK